MIPHPAHPPRSIRSVLADLVRLSDGRAMARYRITGIDELVLPEFAGRGRQNDLWRTTCFELFLKGDGAAYREYNFAPSGRWAAYAFDSVREGMKSFDPIHIPEISVESGDMMATAVAFIAEGDLRGMSHAGLTAVIEESGGHMSYWALAHGGERPDFHDPACFALELGAAAPA
ncbi:hypothetical protein AB433_08440 [Croceicoccus naphthovorans]|uniref:DOMON-like domain-containing protein n=1 Tax=Croceicoccus naphthovorans TaxID=1348774 RepID=A0A0G3XJE5_9SPHN|nr:hypothetical protein AB433_08440 [Croceicoccus naphthovorans]